MVIRDLLVYAQVHDASVLHYSDDSGLEADSVYQLPDGRYSLIEIKTGMNEIPTAEKVLLKFADRIRDYNEKTLADPKHPRATYPVVPASHMTIDKCSRMLTINLTVQPWQKDSSTDGQQGILRPTPCMGLPPVLH